MAEIIKEYCEGSGVVVLRESAYGSSLKKFLRLWEEFKKDFPNLNVNEDRDVEIKHYGGRYYAKTFGLEINIGKNSYVPEFYNRISQLEYTA